MPRRPREHQIEDIARNHLREAFATVGWVVEDLWHDYGEDLLVRIFEKGEATPLFFFVQSKSTDHIETFQIAGGSLLSYPISTAHLRSWNRLWEPVLITVCDIRTETTYWQSVQSIVEANPQALDSGQKSVRVHIPTSNTLDEKAIGEIWALTQSRFGRFEREHEGSQALLGLLETLGQDVDYDPEMGLLWTTDSQGKWNIRLFGVLEEIMLARAREQGVNTDDNEEMSAWFFYDALAHGGNPPGTFEEFKQFFRGERELVKPEWTGKIASDSL